MINLTEGNQKVPHHPLSQGHSALPHSVPLGHTMEEVWERVMFTEAWFFTQHFLERLELSFRIFIISLVTDKAMTIFPKHHTALHEANQLLLLICMQRISSTV